MLFAQIKVLWLLILVPALAVLAWTARISRRRRLRRFVSPEVLPRLLVGDSALRYAMQSCLRIGAIGLCVVALARPQWGRRDEPVVRRGVDVVMALDLSASMLAEDVSPNRLEQARSEAASLVDSLNGDRVGLVVFGGRATVQCPLTLDYGAVRLFLDAAEPDFAPGPGSDLRRAIEESERLFNASERRYKTIVLLSDGEDLEGGGVEAAARAHKDGIVVHAIGVGTQGGGPIPLRDDKGALTGYKKDKQGRVVTTRFDPGTLEKIALTTEGVFLQAGPAGEEGKKIAETIGQMEKKEIASRLATRFEDRYQIPLALALLLLGIEAVWIGRRPRSAVSVTGAEKPGEPGRAAAAALILVMLLSSATASPSLFAQEKEDSSRGGAPKGAAADSRTATGEADDATEPSGSAGEAPPGAAGASPPGAAGPRGKGTGQTGRSATGSGRAGAPRGGTSAPPREDRAAPGPAARRNREGNRLYRQKRYPEALSRYEQASAEAPDLPSLRYNIGNALYRQGKYDAAASEYQRALQKAGAGLAPSVRYNLGNAAFQQKQYQQAIDAYGKVLEQHPDDEAARRNLELALRAMRQKREQEKQQSSDQNKTKPDNDRQKQKNQSQQAQNQKDESQDQPKENDSQENPSGNDSDRKKTAGEGKIGKKEAERLLDSLSQEEKRDLKKRLARLPREEGPEKDW